MNEVEMGHRVTAVEKLVKGNQVRNYTICAKFTSALMEKY